MKLSRHVATCMRLGISTKYPEVMAKAKAKAAELGQVQQVVIALSNSMRSRDLGALEAAMAKATELNMTDQKEVREATAMKATLEAEAAADKTVAEAIAAVSAGGEDADLAPLKAAYEAGAALDLKSDRMDQARVMLDRDGAVADTESKCKVGKITRQKQQQQKRARSFKKCFVVEGGGGGGGGEIFPRNIFGVLPILSIHRPPDVPPCAPVLPHLSSWDGRRDACCCLSCLSLYHPCTHLWLVRRLPNRVINTWRSPP